VFTGVGVAAGLVSLGGGEGGVEGIIDAAAELRLLAEGVEPLRVQDEVGAPAASAGPERGEEGGVRVRGKEAGGVEVAEIEDDGGVGEGADEVGGGAAVVGGVAAARDAAVELDEDEGESFVGAEVEGLAGDL
jgi:hypothetical protein